MCIPLPAVMGNYWMIDQNPYQSPASSLSVEPGTRSWKGEAASHLDKAGLLYRRIIVKQPVEVTVEYLARGLRDRILVDGKTVVWRIPIFWFYKRFEFQIPYCDGQLPAIVRVRIRPRSLRLEFFELEIRGIVVYRERDGTRIPVKAPAERTT